MQNDEFKSMFSLSAADSQQQSLTSLRVDHHKLIINLLVANYVSAVTFLLPIGPEGDCVLSTGIASSLLFVFLE